MDDKKNRSDYKWNDNYKQKYDGNINNSYKGYDFYNKYDLQFEKKVNKEKNQWNKYSRFNNERNSCKCSNSDCHNKDNVYYEINIYEKNNQDDRFTNLNDLIENRTDVSEKRKIIALFLAIIFPIMNRFYCGRYFSGTLKLMLIFSVVVIVGLEKFANSDFLNEIEFYKYLFLIWATVITWWYLIDIIIIALGKMKDKENKYIKY